MRISKRQSEGKRSGASAVEFAIVAIPLFMFLFGIYEYGRYVMALQTLENAAREGARFAVVNTFDDDVVANTEAEVRQRMAGVDESVFGAPATISVYHADASGNQLGSPLNAAFGEYIGVRIQGEYRTMLPDILIMPDTITMDVRALMLSEAN